ncbi:hypothetical protein N9A45_01510 [bacterium]|nr:hypothetical protein [bacterium]
METNTWKAGEKYGFVNNADCSCFGVACEADYYCTASKLPDSTVPINFSGQGQCIKVPSNKDRICPMTPVYGAKEGEAWPYISGKTKEGILRLKSDDHCVCNGRWFCKEAYEICSEFLGCIPRFDALYDYANNKIVKSETQGYSQWIIYENPDEIIRETLRGAFDLYEDVTHENDPDFHSFSFFDMENETCSAIGRIQREDQVEKCNGVDHSDCTTQFPIGYPKAWMSPDTPRNPEPIKVPSKVYTVVHHTAGDEVLHQEHAEKVYVKADKTDLTSLSQFKGNLNGIDSDEKLVPNPLFVDFIEISWRCTDFDYAEIALNHNGNFGNIDREELAWMKHHDSGYSSTNHLSPDVQERRHALSGTSMLPQYEYTSCRLWDPKLCDKQFNEGPDDKKEPREKCFDCDYGLKLEDTVKTVSTTGSEFTMFILPEMSEEHGSKQGGTYGFLNIGDNPVRNVYSATKWKGSKWNTNILRGCDKKPPNLLDMNGEALKLSGDCRDYWYIYGDPDEYLNADKLFTNQDEPFWLLTFAKRKRLFNASTQTVYYKVESAPSDLLSVKTEHVVVSHNLQTKRDNSNAFQASSCRLGRHETDRVYTNDKWSKMVADYTLDNRIRQTCDHFFSQDVKKSCFPYSAHEQRTKGADANKWTDWSLTRFDNQNMDKGEGTSSTDSVPCYQEIGGEISQNRYFGKMKYHMDNHYFTNKCIGHRKIPKRMVPAGALEDLVNTVDSKTFCRKKTVEEHTGLFDLMWSAAQGVEEVCYDYKVERKYPKHNVDSFEADDITGIKFNQARMGRRESEHVLEAKHQGYSDIWDSSIYGSYGNSKALLVYSPIVKEDSSTVATEETKNMKDWALEKSGESKRFGFPYFNPTRITNEVAEEYEKENGEYDSAGNAICPKEQTEKAKKDNLRYHDCPDVWYKVPKCGDWKCSDPAACWTWSEEEWFVKPKCVHPESMVVADEYEYITGTDGGADVKSFKFNKHYNRNVDPIDMNAGHSGEYLFDASTRYQFKYGATIHVKYYWQSYTLDYDLKTGTIPPVFYPYVHYNKMFENVPEKSSKRCHFKNRAGFWNNKKQASLFGTPSQNITIGHINTLDKNILASETAWLVDNMNPSKAVQFVLRGDSFEFCKNDVEVPRDCLCGKRRCRAGQWCYYKHFVRAFDPRILESNSMLGEPFDLVGHVSDRKIVPCESVDPDANFTTSTADIKKRTTDCVCGTRAIDPSKKITSDNIEPVWVNVTDGAYITCNFALNIYGQSDMAMEVPILGPPCENSYGFSPNDNHCSCYATKNNRLNASEAREHVYWSNYFLGQYCFRAEERVEHIAYALVTDGYCQTYDSDDGEFFGPWDVVKNPDQCLEGSRRIDDKTLTINPKVRYTRAKHDQSGCSWDKGGWYLLFNSWLPKESGWDDSVYTDPEHDKYMKPCDATWAEDPTRSGCICQLRGERCDAVLAESPLDATHYNKSFCLCGQKKCTDGKYCYEKLSGCEDSNAFTCNVFENQCWPESAQRILVKTGVRLNKMYSVEKLTTDPQSIPVCGEGIKTTGECLCGDRFKVLPTICSVGEYCHHRLSTCYSEKQELCPTNVYNTEMDMCVCGLKKNRAPHLMNVYQNLDEATKEPEDQSKFFDTVDCEIGQLCVLRNYGNSLEPDAACLSQPVDPCVAYPSPIEKALCQCGNKMASRNEFCYKGEVREERFPMCKDMKSHPNEGERIMSNCYCVTTGGNVLLEDGDNKYCDFRPQAPAGVVRDLPTMECDYADVLTSEMTQEDRCLCRGTEQNIVCATGEMCGKLQGGQPNCYDEKIKVCDASLSCAESLAESDNCFCDGIETERADICTGAGIVKNPVCDRYESPYDVVKKGKYFHSFNMRQFHTRVQNFTFDDMEIFGERYDAFSFPNVADIFRLKPDAPGWCDPLAVVDHPEHYECLYLPTRAKLKAKVSLTIDWSSDYEYLIPGASTVKLATAISLASDHEIRDCEAYRVTVDSNGNTADWEADDRYSTMLDNIQCPDGSCIQRKDSDGQCRASTDCIPETPYQSCDRFGTAKRKFTWKKYSDVFEKSNLLSQKFSAYNTDYDEAYIIEDTPYIDSGIFTENDELDFSTEILDCELHNISTGSVENIYDWKIEKIEERRSSFEWPVQEEGEKMITCTIGIFSADILERKDPTPLETITIERRFMGGYPGNTHFKPRAAAVDVRLVPGNGSECYKINGAENTNWKPIYSSFHRNPCNILLDRSNTYQFAYRTNDIDRIEDMDITTIENEQTCILEREYRHHAEVDKWIASGSCKKLRALPEGMWADRLDKTHFLAHEDPTEECAQRCHYAFGSSAFTMKTSIGIPTWLNTHVGFESDGFTDKYAGTNFWEKFKSLTQVWRDIPTPQRLDKCACASDTCDQQEHHADLMPQIRTGDLETCFETFFPMFFELHNNPKAQKKYFDEQFVQGNVCGLGTETNRFEKTYYRSYSIKYDHMSILSPHITNITVVDLEDLNSLDIQGFNSIVPFENKYRASICIKYEPWCPVISEATPKKSIHENQYECLCYTEAKKETWDEREPFWVYERKRIFKSETKYCFQEPDTRKLIIHKKPCSAYNKTIPWELGFNKSVMNNFEVENLQECFCGGDNELYCSATEFCLGDTGERVCQSIHQLIDADIPVRVVDHGTCSDMPGWTPVFDPLFCYAHRELLLRPHGHEISSSELQPHTFDAFEPSVLMEDVKYTRLGDLQDKHEADELYYGLSFPEGCSLSWISDMDANVPFYDNVHLKPIEVDGQRFNIGHHKYNGQWGQGCAIPSQAKWYFETPPDRYSSAYYSCDKNRDDGIWPEYYVKINQFGTTRALPKLHSGDINRPLGIYAKFGKEDTPVGQQVLQVNTKDVEYMQFSQLKDIPAEIYSITYSQKKLCKLERPSCDDVQSGADYDSKYCVKTDRVKTDRTVMDLSTATFDNISTCTTDIPLDESADLHFCTCHDNELCSSKDAPFCLRNGKCVKNGKCRDKEGLLAECEGKGGWLRHPLKNTNEKQECENWFQSDTESTRPPVTCGGMHKCPCGMLKCPRGRVYSKSLNACSDSEQSDTFSLMAKLTSGECKDITTNKTRSTYDCERYFNGQSTMFQEFFEEDHNDVPFGCSLSVRFENDRPVYSKAFHNPHQSRKDCSEKNPCLCQITNMAECTLNAIVSETCLCGTYRDVVMPGGMCVYHKPYSKCFDSDQSVRMNWPCICGDKIVSSKEYCSIREEYPMVMAFSRYGADFEANANTCHFQAIDVSLYRSEQKGLISLPSPHDPALDVIKPSGTRSNDHITIENVMHDLNDLAQSIHTIEGGYTLGTENHSFAGLYDTPGLFCTAKKHCYFGLPGNYSAKPVLGNHECTSSDHTYTKTPIYNADDCAAACGKTKHCHLFSYRDSDYACKLEKTYGKKCSQGWIPSNFSTFAVHLRFDTLAHLKPNCTNSLGKDCYDSIGVMDKSGKEIYLGGTEPFRNPEMGVKGLYHTLEQTKVHYYIGEQGDKHCTEDVRAFCGIQR